MILNFVQTKLSKAVSLAKTQYYKIVVLAEDDEKKRARLISDFAGSYGVDVINLNLHMSKRLLEKSAKKRVSALLEELRDIVAADATLVVLNLTGLPYPQVKEIADYLVHQLLLQKTGEGGFVLADTIRQAVTEL